MKRNQKISELFNELSKYYNILGEVYRAAAYERAAKTIANYTLPIKFTTLYKLGELPGIGDGIIAKIREFLETNSIQELQKMKKDKTICAYLQFTQILGVGPKIAKNWISAGIYNIADVKRAYNSGVIKLTHMQLMGLTYFCDLNIRIPRREVEQIVEELREYLQDVEILGSYRRGAATSGDIDLMTQSGNMTNIYKSLREHKNFVNHLRVGEQVFTFLWKGSHVRQVDLFMAKPHQVVPYRLYATGSAEFNERIRGYCKRMGYRLNQYELRNLKTNKVVVLQNEYDFFKELKIDYVAPEKR